MAWGRWTKVLIVAAAAMTAAACSTYPTEPRYSTRPMPLPGQGAPPVDAYGRPTEPVASPYESPPPATAPYETIDGGALDAPAAASDGRPGRDAPPPPGSAAASAGSAGSAGTTVYVIQQGDTISGVGRRFQTPVQTLIDLNNLGPRAAISPGQRVRLPDTAVDRGPDPFATGPSPVGVTGTNDGLPPPPPPPPPSGNPPMPRADGAATTSVRLDWPVRGDILRRFGPVGMGERNNGVNIGAPAGAEVRASAAGRVGYVGDDLAGQGLTVLIVHADGWRTVYGHLGSATVGDGDDIRAGQVIGTVGTTAGDGRPSIHFETWRMRGDEPTAIDPLSLLPR